MDYSTMTLSDLRQKARELGMRGFSALKKNQLIEKIQQQESDKKTQKLSSSSEPDGRKDLSETTEISQISSETVARDIAETGKTADNSMTEGFLEKTVRADSREKAREKSPETDNREKAREKSPERDSREKSREADNREKAREKSPETDNCEKARETDKTDSRENIRKKPDGMNQESRRQGEKRNPRSSRQNERRNDNTNRQEHTEGKNDSPAYQDQNESGENNNNRRANGILEVVPDGFGFIRCENYLSGENDVYVAPSQIRRFNLKTGDVLTGLVREKNSTEKFAALLYVEAVNGYNPYEAQKRKNFSDLTPIFPNEKIRLETPDAPVSMRIMDILSPIGKGQRGMIVSQPKTGKTTLLKQIAKSIQTNNPEMKMIILLIDERPEEVTDFKEYIEGDNVEVIYSTFDEAPDHHMKVASMVLERARRLVEHKEDVVILLDSITRLARANNMVVEPSGRTLSGGLDPKALEFPKKFFGAARNMREGGSLTILATALVETGSKMDDVVFEEFKGTGNMELVLDRKLAERRIFPAINIQKSSTRRDDLLLTKEELEVVYGLHRKMTGAKAEEYVAQILSHFKATKNNEEFVKTIKPCL